MVILIIYVMVILILYVMTYNDINGYPYIIRNDL